jgi:hypothetical protein
MRAGASERARAIARRGAEEARGRGFGRCGEHGDVIPVNQLPSIVYPARRG